MHNEPSLSPTEAAPIPDLLTPPKTGTINKPSRLPMLMWGILSLIAQLTIGYKFGLLPLAIGLLAIYTVVCLYGNHKLATLGKALGYVVRSDNDLARCRAEVNFNMKAAYILMITVWPLLISSLVLQQWLALIALLAVNFILTPIVTATEKKFKAMAVESADPTLATRFQTILTQWQEPRFRLENM
jgi:hypothetical protein